MLIELSYPLSPDMPVYPGSPVDSFTPNTAMLKGDSSNTTVIHHYIHGGTHVDAPFHFDADGIPIDRVPIEDFCFEKPVLVSCPMGKSGLILKKYIENTEGAGEADIFFLDTGYSAKRENREVYSDDFPALSEEAAIYIRNELLNVKAVAIDTLSIESAVKGSIEDFPVHRTLLDSKRSQKRPVLIFEDVNIALLRGADVKRIYAFPLRLKGVDGSPVNIVAEVNV